eukprot:CAMPEP_0183308496 /NCGR_PEP_ID=MMETSP0160_2-20130417/22292_1 /TAXON_ID=2839 ORGANISM="Odontella Sinensis, Strain Grunow 1884" /NCGR_SAMPLE_ID=MMETSP0160_2 /ASSEMBLY_ACC=CAM_ASM_000250 /LENGTH=62 /DNA_ID=CAMNT_0025472347 /DNA_START=401 /DNA_END=586 /DNA_ORIENTATION=-
MPQKTLEKEALEEFLYMGRNVDAVMYQVKNGKNAMPAFRGRLSDQDIENIATFVISASDKGW